MSRADRTSLDRRRDAATAAAATRDPFATRGQAAFQTMRNYDPDEFYMSASDKRGHDKQVRVHVPPELLSQIDMMVASRRFPYFTSAAFIRDAMVHRLQHLAEISDNAETLRMLAVHQATDKVRRHMEAMKQHQELVDGIKMGGAGAIEGQDWEQLWQLVASATTCMDDVREPYRGRLAAMCAEYRKKLDEVGFDPEADLH